ncbi:MAG: hypothetical protein V9E90_08600, partial [Saprospiraceae bacterium]
SGVHVVVTKSGPTAAAPFTLVQVCAGTLVVLSGELVVSQAVVLHAGVLAPSATASTTQVPIGVGPLVTLAHTVSAQVGTPTSVLGFEPGTEQVALVPGVQQLAGSPAVGPLVVTGQVVCVQVLPALAATGVQVPLCTGVRTEVLLQVVVVQLLPAVGVVAQEPLSVLTVQPQVAGSPTPLLVVVSAQVVV